MSCEGDAELCFRAGLRARSSLSCMVGRAAACRTILGRIPSRLEHQRALKSERSLARHE
jgi:hypothetical protein